MGSKISSGIVDLNSQVNLQNRYESKNTVSEVFQNTEIEMQD